MQTKRVNDIKKRICTNTTKLEIILISVTITLSIITLTLIILLSQPKDNYINRKETEDCHTQICIKEALQILERIDADQDPCENFYSFACSNVENLTMKNARYGPFTKIVENFSAKIEQQYNEDILLIDHPLVKTQKLLYQSCMNESLERDSFKTLRDAIIFAGGWPVIEGNKWNEANFDLLQATYKLRQLGYLHSIFLDLNLAEDPKKKDGYIFQISIPLVEDVYSKFFNTDETNGFMADIAVVFGAEVHRALGEMTQTLEFLLDLQWIQTNNEETDEKYQRITVEEIQEKHGTINWLNYINQISGVLPKITNKDYVLFPSESLMDSWLNMLIKAPKRLHANYMMWRVVEDNLPFITAKLRSEKIKPKFMLEEGETRSEFCIDTIRNNFSPSPIDLLFLRKNLPRAKKTKIEKLWQLFKDELKNVARNIPWINNDDKKTLVEKVEKMSIILGAPGDYFDDDIFNKMNYNITPSDFVSMLAQTNKDNLDYRYDLIKDSPKETKLVWWKMLVDSSVHLISENEIELSPTVLQDFIFNDQRPNYLNYGLMGLAMKNILSKIMNVSTDWAREVKCNLNLGEAPNYVLYHAMSHILASQISYKAYRKWVTENNAEPTLYPLDYTPDQLFWISSGQIYCHYTDPIFIVGLANGTYDYIIKDVINNNSRLIQDFGCGVYIENKCRLY